MGRGWVAAATSAMLVRLFSIGGVQREVFSLPGPVVCMAGHGEQLLIVYHRGMKTVGRGRFSGKVSCRVTRERYPVVFKGPGLMAIRPSGCSSCSSAEKQSRSSTANLCLFPASPTWHGWASVRKVSRPVLFGKGGGLATIVQRNDTSAITACVWGAGTPCAVDSEGVVRMLNRSLGNTWTPVCDTRESCKSRSDRYWVVGVHENPQQLR